MTARLDKLKTLADYLEHKVKNSKFNLSTWKCGTMACAMGHACSIPEFRKHGLVLDDEIPRYECCLGLVAAKVFFSISDGDASYLFYPDAYDDGARTRMDVVRRIRKFIAEKKLAKNRVQSPANHGNFGTGEQS